ncbi:MAG: hypothetical protein LBP92_15785 [Deltaproteobacteria bacterium]|nr:hypothetical protein [Deltaproteobacteria bacterium]
MPLATLGQDSAADKLRRLEKAAGLFMDGPANTNRSPIHPEKAFRTPFIGIAAGDDPYWDAIKEVAGERHWTPLEAFRVAHPATRAGRGDLSVVVVVCPQTAATFADQKAAVGFPAERWIRSRFFHDQVVGELCGHLARHLESDGCQAVIPDSLAGFSTFPHSRLQIASNWSHRHAAFAAGLGTFGLCDGLITKAGKAHRLGSIIVNYRFEPNARPYREAYEYCLFFSKGSCGKCVGRCPAGALSPKGHDKGLCSSFLDSTTPRIGEAHADLVGAYACGLCQAAVPCGDRIPGQHPR